MKKLVLSLLFVLLTSTLNFAQIGQGHATGSDYVIVNTKVGLWSIWDPFFIQNRGPNTIQLKSVTVRGIKNCLYDGGGMHCGAGFGGGPEAYFQIHTSCGYAQGGKFVYPSYLFPWQGCDNWFVWRPTYVGIKTWIITFEAVDTVTGADVSLVEVTQGRGQ